LSIARNCEAWPRIGGIEANSVNGERQAEDQSRGDPEGGSDGTDDGWLHHFLAVFNAHDWTMRYVTTFSTEIFSLLNIALNCFHLTNSFYKFVLPANLRGFE
jgi:hypothetical protein